MEIIYFAFHLYSLFCKQPNGSFVFMSTLGVTWKLNLQKYYLHDKLPNESIISMLSNAKMLKQQ